MTPFARSAALALVLAAGGCGGAPVADSPLIVSAVGTRAAPGDPDDGTLDFARRVVMGATAQGLVRFDAAGQIEPGLAETWTVIPGGLSYIFRIREAWWPDGTPVTSEQVARALKRALARRSRNRLAPFLRAIDDIVAMTDRVIEIRLVGPRPDLLKLLAQPDMAVFRRDTMGGSGPFRIEAQKDGSAILTPAVDPPGPGEDEEAPAISPRDLIRLHGERTALGVARYKAGRAHLVLGGRFSDWPIVQVAKVPEADIRLDPAMGLFGLRVANREGFLADPANRAAIAMAFDRPGLTAQFDSGWAAAEALLPAELDSAAAPAPPPWSSLSPEDRRAAARNRVAAWKRTHPDPIRLRIALPPGPGSNLVWASLARALAAIGIRPERVGERDAAELMLVDLVAPYDSARWYLAQACRPCSQAALTLIDAARDAPTLEERGRRIAEADAALAADTAFIPLATPLRWSIVTNRVNGWQGNARAWHPLNHLRNEGE